MWQHLWTCWIRPASKRNCPVLHNKPMCLCLNHWLPFKNRHEASAIAPRGNTNVHSVCWCGPQMKLLSKVSRSLRESDSSLEIAGVSISIGFLNNKNKECAKLEWRQGSNTMSHAAQETWGWYCNHFYPSKQKAVWLPLSREIAS